MDMNTSLYLKCGISDVHSSWSHFVFGKIILTVFQVQLLPLTVSKVFFVTHVSALLQCHVHVQPPHNVKRPKCLRLIFCKTQADCDISLHRFLSNLAG